ncbi:uncharacterized protein PGTG_13855 [Puccinia graminis f. sp. tritici CRL 75-36-700-3]|uniref:Uncharacterized protein n=1 Tax=Puccinia graminis f. sp. tritici (strain CRL 75-36-700-3 / race SCCL) TaxID=418459 RepID=E3KUF8_PUCGT|nr:uncharacterized protein PGTG_13855 [Puccinia graminis f. sp. tritici CRL 75-36-700-3]EFP88051.1 hypothetical protein PGTG_13855 [Puccinia graminis f. sp. tritici CRL 75-36-700-3]
MQKGRFLRPSDPRSDSYESRIKHLEGVVQLLLIRTEPHRFPLASSAPLAGSFRYSKDRGLVPLLSHTTGMSLAADWKKECPSGLIPLNSQPRRHTFRTSCKPPSPRTQAAATQCSKVSLLPVSLPSMSSAISKSHSDSKLPPLQATVNPTGVSASPTSDTANKPTSYSHLDSPYSPLASVRVLDERPANTTSFLPEETPSPPPTPPYLPSTYPSITQGSSPHSARSSSPVLSPGGSLTVCEPSGQPSSTPTPLPLPKFLDSNSTSSLLPSRSPTCSTINSPLSVPSTTITTQPATLPNSYSQISSSPIVAAHGPSTTTVVKPQDTLFDSAAASLSFTAIAATSSTTSRPIEDPKAVWDRSLAVVQLANQTAEKSLNATLIPVTTPSNSDAELAPPHPSPSSLSPHSISTTITNAKLSPPSSTQPNPTHRISDTTNHHPLHPLDCFSPPESRIAPEYSQATLDYYNDIQEYLQQANADETETKKKKKKKKKKKANPTSTPNNPILFYV